MHPFPLFRSALARARRAFSLIELAVVLIVIGVIAAIAIPTFQSVIERSEVRAAVATQEAVARDVVAILAFQDPADSPESALTTALKEAGIGAASPGVWAAPALPPLVEGESSASTPNKTTSKSAVSWSDDGTYVAWATFIETGKGVKCRILLGSGSFECWGSGSEAAGFISLAGPAADDVLFDSATPTTTTTTTGAPTTTTTEAPTTTTTIPPTTTTTTIPGASGTNTVLARLMASAVDNTGTGVGTDRGSSVATDAAGNIYVGGYTNGAFTTAGQTKKGNTDAFVAKYNSSGTQQWLTQFGTTGNDQVNHLTVDAAGNVYVTGFTGGSYNEANAGSNDLLVAKFNTSGVQQWAHQVGTLLSDVGNSIAVDSSGNTYIAGYANGQLGSEAALGGSDSVLVKYSAGGALQWIRQSELSTSGTDAARSVVVDASGNAYVTGDSQYGLAGQSWLGDYDGYIAKYNPSGVQQWVTEFGSYLEDRSNGITLTPTGDLAVTGTTKGSFLDEDRSGTVDYYVAKFSSTGSPLWAHQYGASGATAYATAIASDASGTLYVGGEMSIGALPSPEVSAGGKDIFLARYDASGTRRWAHQLGTAGDDRIMSIHVDSSNQVFFAGWAAGSIFGQTQSGAANPDAYFAKLG